MARLPSRAASDLVPDPSWRPLYRVGAVAAGLAVILYVVALILFVVTPTPPLPASGGAAMLEHVVSNRSAYVVKQVLWVAPNLLMMVVVLAIAVALAQVNKSFALTAGVIAVASWAVSFAWPTTGEGSLAMVVLSDRYAEAATDAERVATVAGAELLLALNDLPAVVLGVLQTLGILLLAALMTRGVFPKGLAWLGGVTGAIGIVAEALRPWLGWAYAVYGLLLFGWLIWVAVALGGWEVRQHPASVVGRQCDRRLDPVQHRGHMQGNMGADGGERTAGQHVAKRHDAVADERIDHLGPAVLDVAQVIGGRHTEAGGEGDYPGRELARPGGSPPGGREGAPHHGNRQHGEEQRVQSSVDDAKPKDVPRESQTAGRRRSGHPLHARNQDGAAHEHSDHTPDPAVEQERAEIDSAPADVATQK
jgi:hypothetical protein